MHGFDHHNSFARARNRFRRSRDRGSVLLSALCIAAVLAVAVTSYLAVCQRTLELSTRSLQSAHSITLAESGIEEALWSLNKNEWSGWTIVGKQATKTVGGFDFGSGLTGSIVLSVANYDGTTGTRTLTVTGTTTRPDGTAVSRTLTSTATRAPLFVNALAATTGAVRFSAATTATLIDSYDSSLGPYASQTPGFSAIISAGSTATTSATVQLTNAQIRGYVATVATGPSYSIGATVKGPNSSLFTRIDSSRISTSPYQPIFDITPATGTGTSLSSDSNLTLGTPGASAPSIYYASSIDLRGNTSITIDGPVRLVVSGNFWIGREGGGSPQITVTENGSVEIFVGGDVSIRGNGISNATLAPERLAIFSTNTSNSSDMNTSTPFFGVLYVPAGDFTVSSSNTLHGAIVVRNLTFTGSSPVVHYDLKLRQAVFPGIDTPFAISDWREVSVD